MDWNLVEEVDGLFRKTVRRFVKERDKISIEGISLPGLLILHKIILEGEQRLGDLAEQLEFTSGAITALCDKLEQHELALRTRKKNDRRTVWLDITPKGREMYQRHQNIGSTCADTLFAAIPVEDLKHQIQIYRQMLQNLDRFSQTILTVAERNKEAAATGQANQAH